MHALIKYPFLLVQQLTSSAEIKNNASVTEVSTRFSDFDHNLKENVALPCWTDEKLSSFAKIIHELEAAVSTLPGKYQSFGMGSNNGISLNLLF